MSDAAAALAHLKSAVHDATSHIDHHLAALHTAHGAGDHAAVIQAHAQIQEAVNNLKHAHTTAASAA